MAKLSNPHAGSLQFWPRKRAAKRIPSVNWSASEHVTLKKDGLKGYIAYKVGMATAIVKDNTEQSMTKGKKLFMPVTILEVPPMRIYSVRFYGHNGKVMKDILVSNEKELKRVVTITKTLPEFEKQIPLGYASMRVIVYSMPSKSEIKKTPDLIEIAISAKDPLAFVKAHLHKEFTLADMPHFELVDVRGLTTGKGLVGALTRFGINLKQHKSEKGRRRPGSLGPWHPHRVTFRVPMAGQLGMFSRMHYNLNMIHSGNINEKDINPKSGFKHYGKINSAYIILKGSVQGPPTRQILITPAYRPTKLQNKKKYEFGEIVA